MSEATQRKAYELGREWKLADGVLEMSRLKEVVDTDGMTDGEFWDHWIQVENGIQHEPFKMIEEVRNMRVLTPYDTGERAQPFVWEHDGDFDRYGLVDFDDDEGRTVATVVVRRDESGGYVLEVTGHGPDLTIKDCGVM